MKTLLNPVSSSLTPRKHIRGIGAYSSLNTQLLISVFEDTRRESKDDEEVYETTTLTALIVGEGAKLRKCRKRFASTSPTSRSM